MSDAIRSSDASTSWLSAYLFHDASVYGPECDHHLLETVFPFVDGCVERKQIDRWFFIRYGEDGPHIRLRMHGNSSRLNQEIRPALEEHVQQRHPAVVIGARSDYAGPARPGEIVRLAWVPYEPEIERYGGVDGVRLAEEVFHLSSSATVALLRQVRGRREARLGRGLLNTVLAMHVFHRQRDQVARFAKQYATSYVLGMAREEGVDAQLIRTFDSGYDRQTEALAGYIEDAWGRLEASESLTDDLDRVHEHLLSVRSQLAAFAAEGRLIRRNGSPATFSDAAREIVPSYLHMSNNRLGLSIMDEAYLGHLIHRCLSGRAVDASSVSSGAQS